VDERGLGVACREKKSFLSRNKTKKYGSSLSVETILSSNTQQQLLAHPKTWPTAEPFKK
jgi:hypothetical protein